MGQSLPKPALRPYLASDTPMLAQIFVAAIHELTGDDYSEAQQEAWAAAADATGGEPASAAVEALADDLNTAQMLAAVHALRHQANSSEKDRADFAATLRMLGFLSQSAAEWEGRKQQASGVDPARVESLISDRAAARARKDFKESDRIRDELAAMGVVIKDSKEGTTWEIAR